MTHVHVDVEAVRILDTDPQHPDAVRMKHYAIDAYDVSSDGSKGQGDFSEEARCMAVRTVAAHFGISEQGALDQYAIYITPGPGFHGNVFARAK